ncbi:hypothetical protein [Streptosporangium sp. OZ121]
MTERIRVIGAGISGPDVTWVPENDPGGFDSFGSARIIEATL